MGNMEDGLMATLVAQAARHSLQSRQVVQTADLSAGIVTQTENTYQKGEHIIEPTTGEMDLMGEIADASGIWDEVDEDV